MFNHLYYFKKIIKGAILNLRGCVKLNTGASATYLPVVATENKHWSIDKYMASLSEKAGGDPDAWKLGTIWIYSSKTYTWDVNKNSIVS